MNENKTTTYGDLKCRKQEMRNEGILGVNMEEYLQNMNAIKDAEAVLLWGITPDESCGELPRQRKCRTGALICFVIAGLATILLIFGLFGCQTFKGATGDTAWMFQKLSDNVQVDK